MINTFHVQFEKWNIDSHVFLTMTPSCGGWLRFREIPLHLWKSSTFKKIENACGAFVDIGTSTTINLDLIEAHIKVKDNFRGFVPASYSIFDDDGSQFTVNTVAPATRH